MVHLHKKALNAAIVQGSNIANEFLVRSIITAYLAALPPAPTGPAARKFDMGARVRKTKGSSWQGRVVGFYSTALTPIGYCVESEREPGSVQIYPEGALEGIAP